MKKQSPTLQEKLAKRRVKKPPLLLYLLLAYVWKWMFVKKYNIHYTYKINIKDFKKQPYIVISNHASRVDYLYTGIAFLPHRLSYVAGYNEFFRSHLQFVFKLLQVIPKKNFVPEVSAIINISRIIKRKGKVIIFPEGMSSISGSNQPSAIGSGKLLKHFGVPVLMTHIEGGYLTNTKYCLDDRPGRVDVTVSQLFTPEQLSSLSEHEIQLKIDEAIHHDDYIWNKEQRVAFDGKGELAKQLHTLLYKCPICGEEFQMKGEHDDLTCNACGHGITLNRYYDIIPKDPNDTYFETPTAWFDWERKKVYQEILANPDFEFSEHVKIGMLPPFTYLKDLKTSEIVGEGVLSISRNGLQFVGTRHQNPFQFIIPLSQIPTYGMCTDVSFFSTFLNGDYIEFYPKNESTGKWLHITEELHRITGGQWKNFPNTDIYDI